MDAAVSCLLSCSLLFAAFCRRSFHLPPAIDSGVGFPDFGLVGREAGNAEFRDWRAVETLRRSQEIVQGFWDSLRRQRS